MAKPQPSRTNESEAVQVSLHLQSLKGISKEALEALKKIQKKIDAVETLLRSQYEANDVKKQAMMERAKTPAPTSTNRAEAPTPSAHTSTKRNGR